MNVSFDTNVLGYATARTVSLKTSRVRDLIYRGMCGGSTVLLLQTLAEFSSVTIRKAGIPVDDVRTTINAWRAVLPVAAAADEDLLAELGDVKTSRLGFWDDRMW